ncbi:MAG: Gx transporter family protein [Clostridia bacterium]|nr:Gx transporter family protein [Clostridia bacterium]
MKITTKNVARFGLLTALALVLGYLDKANPLSAFLGGAIPGIKLGLANTVLLYAIYLMNWQSAVVLMLVKVVLSGFMFGSVSAILYSLSGGILSLLVMLAVKKAPDLGALAIGILSLISDAWLLMRYPSPRGQMLWCVILITLAALAGFAAFALIRRDRKRSVLGVSLAGAVAHNVGQIFAASLTFHTPQLLYTYLPVLVGIGAAVGCLTGLVARLVFRALKATGETIS